MQRSDSVSSTGSRSSGTFGYHQRLLEGNGPPPSPLSRAASITQRPTSILSPPPGSGAPRKWVPTHRTGQSVDMVQSRMALWEEKARASQAEPTSTSSSSSNPQTPTHAHRRSVDLSRYRPEDISPPPPKNSTPSKRHTLATPIDISTYLPSSPQTPSNDSTTPTRDSYLPSTRRSTRPVLSHLDDLPPEPQSGYINSEGSTDTVALSLTGSSTGSSAASTETAQPPPSQTEHKNSYMLQRRSAKNYGDSLTTGRRLGRHMPRIASGDGNQDPEEPPQEESPPPPPPKEPNRISANRLREERRRSMDIKPSTPSPISPFQLESRKSPTSPASPMSIRHAPSSSIDNYISSPTAVDDVAGVPGRLRLSKTISAPSTPLKARPIYGLWADIQRHLIQAYEYLCHVGEAQQWIEGCLGDELPFGVVEMDEGLRNGVVLARLAQVWDGASVRKIFDVSPLSIFFLCSCRTGSPTETRMAAYRQH